MTDLMVASLNIRGIPLTGSRLAARYAATALSSKPATPM
jgi:hypothetical protein